MRQFLPSIFDELRKLNGLAGILIVIVVSLYGSTTQADITITTAGSNQGLSLTTFATGFPTTGQIGPLGIVFPGNGVLVSDIVGNVRLFPSHADNQLASGAPIGQNYGGDHADGLVQVGSTIYMMEGLLENVAQINPNGTFNQNIVTGLARIVGVAANPVTGHLYASVGTTDILEIDPIAKTTSLLAQTSQPDGMICSPDGHTLYVAALNSGHVLGFDTTTKAQVFDSGPIIGGVDGIALGAGPFANTMFVNLNAGSVIELNMTTLTQLVIASGGTRGDFVAVDPSNDTLLITQTDRIVRLNGAVFVPEPSSYLLLAIGLACLLAFGHRLRELVGTSLLNAPRSGVRR